MQRDTRMLAFSALANAASVTVYLKSPADFAAMNEAYGRFVDAHTTSGVLPSRTTVLVQPANTDASNSRAPVLALRVMPPSRF